MDSKSNGDAQGSTTVFVGNIPYEATEEEMKELFGEVGPVVKFRLHEKGYGFCEYSDEATASSALRNMNNVKFKGRMLRVNQSSSKDDHVKERSDPTYVIDTVLKRMPEWQRWDLIAQMRDFIREDRVRARQILIERPHLAQALLQAQMMLDMVKGPAAPSTNKNIGGGSVGIQPPPGSNIGNLGGVPPQVLSQQQPPHHHRAGGPPRPPPPSIYGLQGAPPPLHHQNMNRPQQQQQRPSVPSHGARPQPGVGPAHMRGTRNPPPMNAYRGGANAPGANRRYRPTLPPHNNGGARHHTQRSHPPGDPLAGIDRAKFPGFTDAKILELYNVCRLPREQVMRMPDEEQRQQILQLQAQAMSRFPPGFFRS